MRPTVRSALALAALAIAPVVLAGPVDEKLDQLLNESSGGVVRIEVRRTFSVPSHGRSEQPEDQPAIQIRGSGIVWDRSGHILTVTDLAQPSDTVWVVDSAGRRAKAEFVNQEPEIGLSLIRIAPSPALRPIGRGVSSTLAPKDWVFLLSDPGAPRTEGRLALGRVRVRVGSDRAARLRLEGDVDPGLAGGAVLDEDGRLVGILMGEGSESLLLAEGSGERPMEFCLWTAGPTEAGWVLPIEQAQAGFASLLERGKQGFLGIRVEFADGDRAAATVGAGVPVARVLPGSPAAQAGILPGDRLIGFGGMKVDSWDELTQKVAATPPNRPVPVQLVRDGVGRTVEVRLADRGTIIWREKQRALAGGREKILRNRLDALRKQLELLRSQHAARP